MLRFLALCLSLWVMPAYATRFIVDAGNPGAITGSGRDLSFDLSAITDPVIAARLEIDINYGSARELDWSLVDASGVVELVLAEMSGLHSAVTMNGRYRLSDTAVTTWTLAASTGGNLPTLFPARAFRFGRVGSCLNLIGRYLEFDIDRSQPLTLRLTRLGSAVATGAINSARLVIDTGAPDEIHTTGMEEPNHARPTCQRPVFDIVVNGGNESLAISPLVLLDYTGAPDWSIHQLDPLQDFGPFAFGTGSASAPYPGRFGGRSRMNLGFWDESTGSLNFTTGAGARTLVLPGDWTGTLHVPIPGDYDGDGITDLGMAFLGQSGGQPRYIARILFSRSGRLIDSVIDPREYDPLSFNSSQIGFGAGQDADQDGADELTVYARRSNDFMSLLQFVFDSEGRNLGPFVAGAWGVPGDRLVLGNWLGGSSGNRFGLMVVRKTLANWNWFLFPNTTPTIWGLPTDIPVSINVDADPINDIAVYRPSDQMLYVIRSSDGLTVVLGPFGNQNSLPLGYLLGTTAPLEF
jgi:hypothetical protein